jgi:hypothetical protein
MRKAIPRTAEPRVMPYGAWLTDARLYGLGFSSQHIQAIRRGEPIGRVLSLRGRRSAPLLMALTVMGAGLLSLSVVSHVREGAAANARVAPTINVTVPPSAESPRAAAALRPALPASPAFSDTRFRFGFLEFEDDADAPPR